MQCEHKTFDTRESVRATYKKALATHKIKSSRTKKSRSQKQPTPISDNTLMAQVVNITEFSYPSQVYTAETKDGRLFFVKVQPINKLSSTIPDTFFGDYSRGCIKNSSNYLFKEIIIDCDVQSHVSSHIAKLHEWGVLSRHKFNKYGITANTPVIYAMYDMVPGQTLHYYLLKTSPWPFKSVTEFIDQYVKFIKMLVYLARKANFRHNDLWTKNMYIVDNPTTGKPEFYLIDLGWSTNSLIQFGSCPTESRYQKRVHSVDQLRTFFFAKLPADHSQSVFDFHKGRLYELDMINLLNCYLTVMYLKYPEHVAWLESTLKPWIHANIQRLNNRKAAYHTRLDSLAKELARKP